MDAPTSERIVWLDVESDGLDPYQGHRLLQLACVVTDRDLQEINDGFMEKIFYSRNESIAMRADADPFVKKMHDRNGLWRSLPTEGVSLAIAEEKLLQELNQCGVKRSSARVGGNSITLDRNFLRVYMPQLTSWLHYRSYDMTSIAGFFQLFRPDVKPFVKSETHDALEDIRQCLEEARYYAHHLNSFASNS